MRHESDHLCPRTVLRLTRCDAMAMVWSRRLRDYARVSEMYFFEKARYADRSSSSLSKALMSLLRLYSRKAPALSSEDIVRESITASGSHPAKASASTVLARCPHQALGAQYEASHLHTRDS
jgi:hypothetical protein